MLPETARATSVGPNDFNTLVVKRLLFLIVTTLFSFDSIKPTFIKSLDRKFGGLRLFLRSLLLFLLSWKSLLFSYLFLSHTHLKFSISLSQWLSHPMISFCSTFHTESVTVLKIFTTGITKSSLLGSHIVLKKNNFYSHKIRFSSETKLWIFLKCFYLVASLLIE